jgi:hypothetical protein
MNWLEGVLPARLPFNIGSEAQPAARQLHDLINTQIDKFQAKVAASAAEHRAEPRWAAAGWGRLVRGNGRWGGVGVGGRYARSRM